MYAGTPAFAVPPLAALIAHGRAPVAVITQPDRPAGRGRRLQASPVKQHALAAGIPVLQPGSLRTDDAVAGLAALEPDLIVVVAFGQLLDARVLALPARGCVNVHASLLPRWRGAAPIHRAILAGDSETGVSIMQMDVGLDTGAVWLDRRVPIRASDTTGSLHDALASLGAAALIDALAAIDAGDAAPVPQPADGATYAHKLAKDEAWLDWTQPAAALARQVRAFDPWPVAQTALVDGTILRIWSAAAMPDVGAAPSRRDLPGTITNVDANGIAVATGDGVLRLLEVQLPGGRRITAREFAAQRALVGAQLGR